MTNLLDSFDQISTVRGVSQQQQLLDRLGVLLKSGALAGETRLPSIRKVSRHFGVTQVTAQQVYDDLHRHGYIQKLHGKGCFLKPASHQFPLSRTGRISVSVKPPDDGEDLNLPTANLLSGFFIGLSERGWAAQVEQGLETGEEFDQICRHFCNRQSDGAAIFGGLGNFEEKIALGRRFAMPMVLINNEHATLPCVLADVEGACRTMAGRLNDRGQERFIVVAPDSTSPRFRGIRAGVQTMTSERGLPEPTLCTGPGDVPLTDQYRQTQRDVASLLRHLSGDSPVMFCSPEIRTMAVMDVLRDLGRQDVQVVSIDDSADFHVQYPQLHRIRVPYFRLGQEGARIIGEAIEQGLPSSSRLYTLTCQIKERST